VTELRLGLGPLGRRLLFAFVLVAASSVVVLTVAALIGVGHGFEVATQVSHEKAAANAAAADSAIPASRENIVQPTNDRGASAQS